MYTAAYETIYGGCLQKAFKANESAYNVYPLSLVLFQA